MRPRVACLALAIASAACGDDVERLPPGTCAAHVWAIPERGGTAPEVVGEWSQWEDAEAMAPFEDGPWSLAALALPPGEYGYLIVEQGRAHVDRTQGLGGFRVSDGVEVSWLRVDDCLQPRVVVPAPAASAGAPLELTLMPARDDATIVAIDAQIDGEPIALEPGDGEGTVTWAPPPLPRGRHLLTLAATDDAGRTGPPSARVLWSEPLAERFDDELVYQVMIDRYRGDGGAPLAPPPNPGARAGGTLDGVRAELERGTFTELGVSTLWLSPVYVNPVEARPGRDDDHLYEGYHGYWPADTRAVDARIGGDAALEALVAAAHAQGLRVLLDLVPNHVDQTHPRFAEHRGEGWFNERDPPCVCGAPECPWATHIETCWFTAYLPDVRFEQRDALAASIDDALWWLSRFGVDGFRVDAVPMMPRVATRRIYDAVRRASGGHGTSLLLGEVFTGPGAAGISALRYHLGPDGLDSAFDFPTMWVMRDALAGRAELGAVLDMIEAEAAALDGSGAVLARMLGNHDVPRIASALAGDEGRDPWSDPPDDDVDAEVLARMRVGFALLLTLPGMPVIYYGDEYGLAGVGDPDNRRVMPEPATVTAPAEALAADVGRLGRLRRCLPALRRGELREIGSSAAHLVFVRELAGDVPALVVLSMAAEPTTVVVPAAVPPGWYKDAMTDARFEVGKGGASLELPPLGVRVLVPEEHHCA